MNPRHYILVRLLWPPGVDRTVLTQARRCLFNHAPVELHQTGYQLLAREHLGSFEQCMQDTLMEAGIPASEVVVLLPAPPVTDGTRKRYQDTLCSTYSKLAEELLQASEKLLTGKLTSRLFNKCYEKLDICTEFSNDASEIVQIRAYLDKISTLEHDKDRKKSSQLVKALAKKVNQLTQDKDND